MGKLIGITDEEAASLGSALQRVAINGYPVVQSVEAFGSRAGSMYRGRPPLPDSDFDIYVTLKSDIANTPANLQQAMDQIQDISDLFGRVKQLSVQAVIELDTIAPMHKRQFDKTPFIPLS